MALDMTDLRSRRALLAGALGAVASAAAATVVGAQRVLGAGSDGEPVVIGGEYPDVRSTTVFRSTWQDGGSQVGFAFHADSLRGIRETTIGETDARSESVRERGPGTMGPR